MKKKEGNFRGVVRAVFAAMAPTIFLLVLLEAGARVYELGHQGSPVDFDGGFTGLSRVFIPERGNEAFLATNPQKTLIFYPQKFAKKKPSGVFRVVFLGESSVHNLHDDLPALAQKLQERLTPGFHKVEIINAGAPSYGSQRLVLVAKEMLAYDPDLLLIYMGHNEFEEVEQFHLIMPERAPFIQAAFHSALIRVATDFWLRLQVRRLRYLRLTDRPAFDRAAAYPFTDQDLRERMDAFRKNLEQILVMSKIDGVFTIIGTVPSNLLRPHLPAAYFYRYDATSAAIARHDYNSARELGADALAHIPGRHQSSAAENAIIRALAKKYSTPLADVEKAVVAGEPHHLPGETLFVDSCHLNERGNKILIQEFLNTFSASWKK